MYLVKRKLTENMLGRMKTYQRNCSAKKNLENLSDLSLSIGVPSSAAKSAPAAREEVVGRTKQNKKRSLGHEPCLARFRWRELPCPRNRQPQSQPRRNYLLVFKRTSSSTQSAPAWICSRWATSAKKMKLEVIPITTKIARNPLMKKDDRI